MNCKNCGHAITDASLGFCTECGELLDSPGGDASGTGESYGSEDYDAGGDYNPDYAWEAPPPSAAERFEEMFSKVAGPVRAVAGQVGDVFLSVLDHPSLRGMLPGGSLSLLGVGLVGLALLLSALPFVAGIGKLGVAVVLLMLPLVAVNEWRIASRPESQEFDTEPARPLPESLENLPEDSQHPVIAQVFALVTCTYALLMLGSPISLVWLLAAGVLGYDQGRRYFAAEPEDSYDLEAGTRGPKPHRWVVVGVVICSFAILLTWGRGTLQVPGTSGAEQPLSDLTQCTLLMLACSAVRHRGLSAFHPLGLILMGVWLTLWFFLMMSPYTVGPWVYLLGLLLIDAAIVFHFLPQRRGGDEVEQEAASDMDFQG